jgi:hypothetical protein
MGHVGVEPQSRGDAGMAKHRRDAMRRLTVLRASVAAVCRRAWKDTGLILALLRNGIQRR